MERSNCVAGVAKGKISENYNLLPTKTKKHHLIPAPTTNNNCQHQLPTVIPTGASRRFFFSFVRERVGLRSGGISLRSIARAKLPRSVDMSLFQPPDVAMQSLPAKR
jgi:hypothetical protein